jgi:simple sugar transport system permease protein
MGSLGIIAASNLFPGISRWLALPMGIGCAALFGGGWGFIAGICKAKRNSHEVIVTILLNFIAYSIVDYSILYLYKDISSQAVETVIVPQSYWLPRLDSPPLGISVLQTTPANISVLLALIACVLVWVLIYKTSTGFELRAVGENPRAARFHGISITRNTVLALTLSGALSGLVGLNEVMGHEHRLIQGFSPQYGFTAIAVALIARSHPLFIPFSAFLFGWLHNMSREIEFASDVLSKELVLVLQAVLIATIACEPLIEKILRRIWPRRGLSDD